MQTALRLTVNVLPGHRLEITAPELPEGEAVEVFVLMPQSASGDMKESVHPAPSQSLLDFLDALPPAPRSAPTWAEIEQNLQAERDAWDH